MALLDPSDDLPQDRAGAAASRSPTHERDHAELAGEAAPVLDAYERADTVEPCIGLNASDRANVARDERRSVLGSPRDDGHVLGQTGERALEVGRAPGHVHAPVCAGGPSCCLARLANGFVRHATRVDDGDLGAAALLVAVSDQRLTDRVRVRMRTLQPRKRTENVATGSGCYSRLNTSAAHRSFTSRSTCANPAMTGRSDS